LDEEPTKPNFFEPFIQDPVNKTSPVSTSAGVSTSTIDKSFRQLVQELNLAAIELQPSDRVFAKANQEAKRIPTLVVPNRPITTKASCELVGISVDGDDRDMLVVIEDQGWVNPFAIR
jgi:hypothetical protein